MDDMDMRLFDLKNKGLCCSQLVVAVAGLDPEGEENEGLTRALHGLCYGAFARAACGALTGGACALALRLSGNLLAEGCKDLAAWFGGRFGGLDCKDILGEGQVPTQACFEAVKETCVKCLEILDESDAL